MRTSKFLLPLLFLTISCTGNKKTDTISKTDTVKSAINNNITDTVKRSAIDSVYLEQLEYIKENPYSDNFDTVIKGGYSISFYHDKEDQYLIYKKGNKIIDTIGDCSLGLPYKNLGYVGADFDKTFVFVNSFGSANPHYIKLLEKETGKNLIPDGSAWIDVDTSEQVLLYSKTDIPDAKDNMSLFDSKKMTQTEYPFPKEIFDEPEKLNRIRLVNVTNKTFTIEYDFKDGAMTKKKMYSR